MPAKDLFHDAVKKALGKDGWTVTDDPLEIDFRGTGVYIDLAAEKIITAQKGSQKIAVEVKSFAGASRVSEFHTALGQFINYRMVLAESDAERVLYLAVPLDAYDDFFTQPFAQAAIQLNSLKLIVYDARKEVLVQWLS